MRGVFQLYKKTKKTGILKRGVRGVLRLIKTTIKIIFQRLIKSSTMKRTQKNEKQMSNLKSSREPSLVSSEIRKKKEKSLLHKNLKNMDKIEEEKKRIYSSLCSNSFPSIDHSSNRGSSRS